MHQALVYGRNPFYSGRFFHSRNNVPIYVTVGKSQSLLFRSVFPFGQRVLPCGSKEGVAIPSIQVGFSITWCCAGRSVNPQKSQSLLFRSVFPFEGGATWCCVGRSSRNPFYSGRFFHWGMRSLPLRKKQEVAIPSIQVGFSISNRREDKAGVSSMSQSLLFRSVFPLAI